MKAGGIRMNKERKYLFLLVIIGLILSFVFIEGLMQLGTGINSIVIHLEEDIYRLQAILKELHGFDLQTVTNFIIKNALNLILSLA